MLVAALAAATIGQALSGVGLGPLHKSGVTDGPAKGFYLTVSNPGRAKGLFALAPEGLADPSRVVVFPAEVLIGANRGRRVLVVVNNLTPDERFQFRVCAEEKDDENSIVHPRVCSTLVAHRMPAAR